MYTFHNLTRDNLGNGLMGKKERRGGGGGGDGSLLFVAEIFSYFSSGFFAYNATMNCNF